MPSLLLKVAHSIRIKKVEFRPKSVRLQSPYTTATITLGTEMLWYLVKKTHPKMIAVTVVT